MNIQAHQLMVLAFFVILIVIFWKVKKPAVRIFVVALAIIIFAVNPFRHKQEGGAKLEATIDRFAIVPEKVVIEEVPFEEHQRQKMRILKQDSLNMKGDIHD